MPADDSRPTAGRYMKSKQHSHTSMPKGLQALAISFKGAPWPKQTAIPIPSIKSILHDRTESDIRHTQGATRDKATVQTSVAFLPRSLCKAPNKRTENRGICSQVNRQRTTRPSGASKATCLRHRAPLCRSNRSACFYTGLERYRLAPT